MKKFAVKIAIISLFVFLHCAMFAQSNKGMGKIYFMRAPRWNVRTMFARGTTNYKMFADSNFLCRLDIKKYAVYNIAAGEHCFATQFLGVKKEKKTAKKVTIDIEPGKSYYMEIRLQRRVFGHYLFPQQIPEDLAKMILPSLKEERNTWEANNEIVSKAFMTGTNAIP